MLSLRTSRVATLMIYAGTFLVSVLSFFTTYMGLAIFLDKWLALIGSLGLQTALLGIAWNLMHMKKNRMSYATVFGMVAVFSMFFSYVNFNTRLKGELRTQEARAEYADAARPVLRDHALQAKKAVAQSEYQVQRLTGLLEMEEISGWATVIDEGSEDPFLQSVIDGARRTVDSWHENQGTEYRQGSGRGIIVDYLRNWQKQINGHRAAMEKYTKSLDSVALLLDSELPVKDQYDMVNFASVNFPLSEYRLIQATEPVLAEPPFTSDYVERPTNGQQALSLVIADLASIDRLTGFSLLFAFVIDMMVLVMALCGSRATGGLDMIFSRVAHDASQRLKKLSTENPEEFTQSMRENIEWFRRASQYGKDLEQVLGELETTNDRIKLARGSEGAPASPTPKPMSSTEPDETEKKRRIIIGA